MIPKTIYMICKDFLHGIHKGSCLCHPFLEFCSTKCKESERLCHRWEGSSQVGRLVTGGEACHRWEGLLIDATAFFSELMLGKFLSSDITKTMMYSPQETLLNEV